MTDCPTPTPDEVVEAEAKAREAGKVHVELAMRAKQLRQAHTIHSAPERIGLRGVDSSVTRFMKADKQRAMAKYAWYDEEVRSRLCPGYRLPDEDAGWQIVDSAEETDLYLQKLEDDGGGAVYTVTSVFGTRYDSMLADGKQLVFRTLDEFLARFPSAAPLDMMVEEHAEEEPEEEEGTGEEDRARDREDEESEGEGEIEGPAADEALRKEALRLVSDRIWREESRRAVARKEAQRAGLEE